MPGIHQQLADMLSRSAYAITLLDPDDLTPHVRNRY
jgi:hypothetical protein